MTIELTPQGAVPAIGIPNSQDTARLVFSAPYFDTVPIAEIILPSVEEAVQAILPSLVPPYVDQAAQAAVQQSAVLLTGSTMSGPLNLSPLLPVSDSMAATKAYVDTMVAMAGVPEVPAVPVGQSWVRQVGQWAPLSDDPGGPFLQLSGGSMQGQINMSGNAITNLPAVPVMPNGAAPATWVLNQISAVSLYQGVWNLDNFTPDLTQPSTHINGYTWIAITNAPAGVVISPAVPGLQGMTVFNGDTVIFSAAQGNFSAIHAGGLTAPQADARYLMLVGGQLSGALLLNANASQPLQAVTLQQLQAFVPPGIVPEAPGDGQLYGRNGLTHAWTAVLPLAGGVMSGALSLSGNASSNLHAVPFQQLNTAIATAVSGYIPITGTTMTGLLTLSGNAGANLHPVPLQQLTSMLGSYAPLAAPAFTGVPLTPTASPGTNTTQIASTAFVTAADNLLVPLTGTRPMTGRLTINANTAALVAAPVQLQTGSADSGPGAGAVFDNFGAGWPSLTLRLAKGTAAAKTAPLLNDILGSLEASGWQGAAYSQGTGIYSIAKENWGAGAHGSFLRFNAVNGTTLEAALMIGRGLVVGGTIGSDPGPGGIFATGTITSTNLIAGNQSQAAGMFITVPGATSAEIGFQNSSRQYALGNGGSGQFFLYDNTAPAYRLQINTDGSCFNLTGTWNAISDGNLKTDVVDLTSGLAQICALRTVSFGWKNKALGPENNWGLIAQEVETVMPELVGERNIAPPDDEQQNIVKTIDPGRLIYPVINAIKELAAQVSELQARIPA
jgi:hypothetical protein